MARELHDVVAHAMSVMVLQVGAVRHRLPASAERDALGNVEQAGRNALTEMRRLLGALRGGDDALELSPNPGLDDLETLAGDVRAAGSTCASMSPANRWLCPRRSTLGVPHRAGGPHQQPQARPRGARRRDRRLCTRRGADRGARRRPGGSSRAEGPTRDVAPGTG